MVKLETDKTGRNNVIVTFYEESRIRRLPRSHNGKIKATKSTPRRMYDRRAELLAHAHKLRNGCTEKAQQDHDQDPVEPTPMPKKRKKLLPNLKKFRLSLNRIFGERKRRWRYESIETQGYERRYQLCRPRKNSWDKFSKRFCRVLKQFSSLWKCDKFSGNEQELKQFDAKLD